MDCIELTLPASYLTDFIEPHKHGLHYEEELQASYLLRQSIVLFWTNQGKASRAWKIFITVRFKMEDDEVEGRL